MDISEMPDRERYVLQKRLLGLTWARIGEELGISRERARQLGARAQRFAEMCKCPRCGGSGLVKEDTDADSA